MSPRLTYFFSCIHLPQQQVRQEQQHGAAGKSALPHEVPAAESSMLITPWWLSPGLAPPQGGAALRVFGKTARECCSRPGLPPTPTPRPWDPQGAQRPRKPPGSAQQRVGWGWWGRHDPSPSQQSGGSLWSGTAHTGPPHCSGCPGGSAGKASASSAAGLGSIPASGRFPGGGSGKLLQCSGLENPVDRGAWRIQSTGGRVRHSDSHTHVHR